MAPSLSGGGLLLSQQLASHAVRSDYFLIFTPN